jgi:hypothetical protein
MIMLLNEVLSSSCGDRREFTPTLSTLLIGWQKSRGVAPGCAAFKRIDFFQYLRPLGYESALIGKARLHPAGAFRYDVKREKYILNLNPNERFITHLSRCDPDS